MPRRYSRFSPMVAIRTSFIWTRARRRRHAATLASNHAPQLAQVLKGATVKHVDILGCNSSAIGALLASLAPGVQVGVLRGRRFDDFEVNMQTMQPTDFRILPQPVYHFGSA